MKRKNLSLIFAFFPLMFFTAYAFATPVPDTGQTKCYDDKGNVITCPSPGQPFYGYDANYNDCQLIKSPIHPCKGTERHSYAK